ncbi:iron transporter [Actinomycetaceae bacterium TAE3-ERU4]|nr:iron transporter [Actinomycetaceae bacterium TAE3-ERU4]
MLNMKKLAALVMVGGLSTAALAGCAQNKGADQGSEKPAASAEMSKSAEAPKSAEEPQAEGAVAVNARPNECGLQEQSGPEATVGPFDMGLHFFQPTVMVGAEGSTMKMTPYEESQMHLELDTKANAYGTNWGYSVDETPASLPIVYRLTDNNNKVLSEGMMMEMAAIDGSHYGLNLPKGTITAPGDYNLTVTVYPPLNYDIHQDYITGVPAKGWFKPLTVTMPWKITQENLDIIKKNTPADPMQVPEACKQYPVKMYEDKASEEAMKKAEQTAPLPMNMHAMHHGMDMKK